MRFNANRLARLAGISDSSSTRSLNEAGNRSRHDDGYDEGAAWYSEDLNEVDDADAADADNPFAMQSELDEPPTEEPPGDEDLSVLDALEEVAPEEWTDADLGGPMEEVVEINESMLRREIARMRRDRAHRANSSRKNLQEESQLRAAIRKEIGSIVGEMNDGHLYTTRNWMYGDNKPQHSKPGQVAVAGLGIGFK